MTDGDFYVTQQPDRSTHYGKGFKLIDNAPSTKATEDTYTGPWCDCSTLKEATVQIDATDLTGVVNIEGTNDDFPTNSSTGYALCSTLDASGLSQLTMPVRFVRARITDFTAGSATVQFHGIA